LDKSELEVIKVLRSLEVPMHVKGYEFIKTAIKYLQKNPSAIYSITKDLYPAVAEIYGTKATRVERGIRYALTFAFMDLDVLKRVMGTSRELTNGEFLATLNEVIKIKLAGAA